MSNIKVCLSDVLCLNSKYIKSNAYKTHKFTKPLPKYVCKVYAYLWYKIWIVRNVACLIQFCYLQRMQNGPLVTKRVYFLLAMWTTNPKFSYQNVDVSTNYTDFVMCTSCEIALSEKVNIKFPTISRCYKHRSTALTFLYRCYCNQRMNEWMNEWMNESFTPYKSLILRKR